MIDEPKQRLPALRWPTRDDRDADHLAILALVGGSIGLCLLPTVVSELRWWWMAACVLGLAAAPLLWLRVPHAKWLAVFANGCLAMTIVLRSGEDSLSLNEYAMIGGLALIAIWYARVAYNVSSQYVD